MDNQRKKSIPLDEEKNKIDKEIEKISDQSVITHYAFINFLIIALIVLFTTICFIVLTGENKIDNTQNPLTLKSFASGKFVSNMEASYKKSIPFPYELKNAGNRLAYLNGFGNEIQTYKKHTAIERISDEDIEQKEDQAKKNIEKAITEEPEENITTSAKKKTAGQKTQTDAQSVTTIRRTTTSNTTTESRATTTTTTINTKPPEIIVTTTIPPNQEQ
ncbi:MAG: hypothetical protein ACI4RC_01995 [Oscillospiraceae bacterium]